MAIEEIKVLLQHVLSVNPIFVVICGPKQPLQNCLQKASFMFMFFKSTKWKHAYLLLPLKPEQFSRMLSQFSHLLLGRLYTPNDGDNAAEILTTDEFSKNEGELLNVEEGISNLQQTTRSVTICKRTCDLEIKFVCF